ncbi:MAG: HDIG domain-containing protein [Candidatus Sericytochromatia bacterium]|nr:HDIG domain-containing protein [Candidatus Tanganyikabacteria bacterium]
MREVHIAQAGPQGGAAPDSPPPGRLERLQAAFGRLRQVLAGPWWVAGIAWAIATTLLLFINDRWFARWPYETLEAVLPEIGVAGLVAGILVLFGTYLRAYEPDVARSPRHRYLLAMVVLSYLGLVLLLRTVGAPPALNPLPAVAMLLAVFVNWRVAIAATVAVAVPLALMPWQGAMFLLVGLAGSWVGIVSVRRIRERWDVGKAGIRAGLAMALGMALAGPLVGTWELEAWVRNLGLAALSGPIAAVLVMGVLPYLERLTGITTAFTLLELANPAQELLRHLLLKAPGTYHHSILVGNLGEAAAEAIGADPLLVRVGAYYHDIGKTKRPYFFIENQQGMGNQHDNISPRLSSLVITAHVKEGIELARQYRLPQQVADFIPMHHGCSLVAYFYHKATQSEGVEEVEEEHYRYPGPRPNTKETAIVMLADGIEATTRTLTRPMPEQIEATVRRIINKRLGEGELSEAPLTLQEIEKIIQAFLRVLLGLYHQRIEYPDQVQEREEKARLQEGRKERKRVGGAGR